MTSYDYMMQKAPGRVNGYTVRATCPFCNHKDTFHWHTRDANPYKCQACGKTGNAFTLGYRSNDYERAEMSPRESFLWQRRRKFGKPWRLSDAVFSAFDLMVGNGTTSKGRVVPQVELCDADGRLQKILRAYAKPWLHPGGKDGARFWLNEQRAGGKGPLYVCAGEWDLFALWEATGLHGISPRNGEGSRPNDTDELRVFHGRDVVICYDNDPTGRANARQLASYVMARVKVESIKILNTLRIGCPAGQDLDYFFNEIGGTAERFFEEVAATQAAEDIEILEEDFIKSVPAREMPLPDYPTPTIADESVRQVIWQAVCLHENARLRVFEQLAQQQGVDPTTKGALSAAIKNYEREGKAMTHQAVDDLVDAECRAINLTAEQEGYTIVTERNYYKYARGVYVPFSPDDQKKLCDEIARAVTPPDSRRAVSLARRDADEQVELFKGNLEPVKFNTDKNLINFRNGLLDIEKGKLIDHQPFYKMTFQLDVDYDEAATCPNFEKALGVWFKDRENRNEFLKSLYYIISGDRSKQVAFFWYGAGGDGKGEAARVLRSLIGEERTSAVSLEDLENKFMIGQLYNKMLNIADEVGRRTLINDSRFKNVTGNSTITADMKYGGIITFESKAQWVILTNNMPSSSDNSRGFARRLKFINFEHVPESSRVDDFFERKLHGELSGIARLILTEGKRLYEGEGFRETAADHETKQDLFRKNSVNGFWMEVLENMFDEMLQTGAMPADAPLKLVENSEKHGKKRYIYPAEHYKKYKEFCEAHGFAAVNQENFRQDSKNQIERAIKDPRVNHIGSPERWVVESGTIRITNPVNIAGAKIPAKVIMVYLLPMPGQKIQAPPPPNPAPGVSPDEPISLAKLWTETPAAD